jgi:tetratricopeptide (TPR) repeat protein
MIFTRGAGILVAIICLGSLAVAQVAAQKLTGDERFYEEHRWVALTAWLAAAALTYGLHRLLLLQKKRIVIDKATGEELVLNAEHSLFCVPVGWWPFVFVAFGVIAVFSESRTSAQTESRTSAQTNGADLKLEQASECGQRGDYASAARLATEVIDREPSHALAYAMRGTAHRRSGEYAQAIADLDRAIELDPRSSYAYTQRACARQQSDAGDSSPQILADANRAIELDPANSLAHIVRGNELAALDDHDAALADYDQAARLNPRSYSALAGRGSSNMSLGRLDEARRDLEEALELDPPAADRSQIEELFQAVESRGN